ncbi:MAG: vitamin B12-dependent ribonucleotide reductase, partial [bacterium]|nr:vitamin B12-dependent ribonucleotide reductase [bacterium]
TALIHKSGGGTGFSFSRLRPESDHVGSTGGVASGPVSFIRAFDTATDVIKQGGMRRGANMAILNVEHPDVMRFIGAKEKQDAFNNFNFSVAVTEKFMRAVEDGSDYELWNPRTKAGAGKLNAKQVFDKMVENAWRNGDPGIVFLDRINKHNPTPHLGAIESTNPCGEQPLLPYESCNLGSINLSRMVTQEAGKWVVDYPRLACTVKLAVRFLDNVIDMNHFPLPQIEQMTKKTRKVGLGVMGFADMLLRLGVSYDSTQGLETGENIMKFIDEKAAEASVELGKERGLFPAFEGSMYDVAGGSLVRNATRTTIAPTGTLSIIAGCSSGIEPLFALSYVRTILDNSKFVEVNPIFEDVAKAEGFYSPQLMEELAQKGSIQKIDGIPDRVKRLFVTALDITPEWHVKMQSAFQRFTNNAVSKTVNFPHDATKEDVAKVYRLAYREGCKGITIYRDRSRDQQVLSTGDQKVKKEAREKLAPRERKRETEGKTMRKDTGCGGLYVTVNRDDEGLCEVFSTLGKAGGCASAQLEAISRLISLAIRSGVDPEYIVKQLRGIRCPSIQWEEGHAVLSCPDAIGSVLDKYLTGESSPSAVKEVHVSGNGGGARNLAGQCPECSGLLVYQEGCLICPFCGYTKCG